MARISRVKSSIFISLFFFYLNFRKEILQKKIFSNSSENSWEPLENLDCQELIEDFEAKLQNNLSPKRKPENEQANKKKKSITDKVELFF